MKNNAPSAPSEPAAAAPSARCPVCGEYVGPARRCARCGATLDVRMSLRVFRWAAVGLATVGLGLLFLAARYREIPRLAVGDIERTMNFAYVRMAGVAADDARAFRRGDRIESLRFTLRDDTGEIVVRAYGDRAREIADLGRAPRAGDRVEVAGTLSIADEGVSLRLQSAEQLRVERVEIPLVPLAEIGAGDTERAVRIAGEVVAVQAPRAESRAPWVVDVRDESGSGRLVFFSRVHEELPDPSALARGARFEARVKVSTYRGEVQLQLESGGHWRWLSRQEYDALRAGGSPPPTPAETPPPAAAAPSTLPLTALRDVLPTRTGEIFRVRGRIESLQPPRPGSTAPWQALLREDEAAIRLVYWSDVAERLTPEATPAAGLRFEAEGRLESYRGALQLRILRARDLRRLPEAATDRAEAPAP